MKQLMAALMGGLVLLLAPGALTAQGFDPNAPVPPGSRFQIVDLNSAVEDLKYRTEAVAGAVATG